MLLQILDRYMFLNQIQAHSITGLLFQVLQIHNDFFDSKFFRFYYF